jgi:protein required for attachment to host cells
MTTWVIVAESSRARVFETAKSRQDLKEIESFSHPESRLHDRDLTSDLPGRAFDSQGQNRHSMEQPVDPKEKEVISFARQLSHYLETARTNNEFQHLGLVAPPEMLGILRETLSSETSKLLAFEVGKNLVKLPEKEISSHLPEHFPA